MNSTEFFIAAGVTVDEWQKNHAEGCYLYIKNGLVCADQQKNIPKNHPTTLIISRTAIYRGYKRHRWFSIGTALHNLYCQELACQAYHKH